MVVAESPSVVQEIQKRGFLVLRELFSGAELDALQADASWFLDHPQPWFSLHKTEHTLLADISPRRAPLSEAHRFNRFFASFTKPVFLDSALSYLGSNTYVDRILVHREVAHPQPVTEWHADQQTDGLLSIKFMLYFNDVDADNGAFSYVPGSHRIVRELTDRARARGLPGKDVHHFSQMRQVAKDIGMNEATRFFDEVDSHIRGDFQSDDFYSLSAPRGSVILFDTKGLHRGGVISSHERYLMRVHCFQPYPISWKGRLRRFVDRDRRRKFFTIGSNGQSHGPIEEYG